VQLRTGTLVVLLLPQVVVVQLFPAFAEEPVHDATPVGPVVAGAGQVVVVQLLPDVAADAVHEATATLVVLLVEHVVVVQALPSEAVAAEQVGVGTLVVTSGLQVTVVQLLPDVGPAAVQLDTGTFVVLTGAQVVAVHPLPELAATGLQLATGVGPVVGNVQLVCVQALPALAAIGEQLEVAVGPVVTPEQVVAVYALPALAGEALQMSTGTDDVQVIVNLSPIVDAGSGQTNTSLQTTLTGTFSDDGFPENATNIFSWQKISGPGEATFSHPSHPVTSVTFSRSGIYALRLSVSDSLAENSADVTVMANAAPEVNAGPDLHVDHHLAAPSYLQRRASGKIYEQKAATRLSVSKSRSPSRCWSM